MVCLIARMAPVLWSCHSERSEESPYFAGAPLHSKRVRPGILLRTFQESCGVGFGACGTSEQTSEQRTPAGRARELRPIAGEPAHVARAEDAGEDTEVH